MPKSFDLLPSAATFARHQQIPITEPSLVPSFTADAARRLESALADPALIYGTRAENLFEAMTRSLGGFRLFKREDVGVVHASIRTRAPDFRIVLDDGEQWLVEVKNVRCEQPLRQRTRLSASYLQTLKAYAGLVSVPLRLALYWSRWNIWTLISPDQFLAADGSLTITMPEAIAASELGRLGDVLIATTAPLRLAFGVAADKPRSLSPDGMAEFTIGSANIYSNDVELTDDRDKKLAMILLEYGDWPVAGPIALMDGDNFEGIHFEASPREPTGQGFEPIGFASQIFSRYFATQTVDGDTVVHLSAEPAPEWFAPLSTWPFGNSGLPLWLFRLGPARPGAHGQQLANKEVKATDNEPF